MYHTTIYKDNASGRWICHVLNRETGDEWSYSCPTEDAAELCAYRLKHNG